MNILEQKYGKGNIHSKTKFGTKILFSDDAVILLEISLCFDLFLHIPFSRHGIRKRHADTHCIPIL